MTTSRSTASPSRIATGLAAAAALLLAAWILLLPSVAEARRRVVVLDFEGAKGDEFREDLEKFLKKSHSVVPRKKWDQAAEDLEATKLSERNIKKVAKKLSVDGVISGKIEKRSSRYYVRVQLRDGTTGKTLNTIELVERSPRFSSDGKGTLTDELLPAIDELESAGDDDEADEDDDGGGFGRGKMSKGKDAGDDGEDDADAGGDDDGDGEDDADGGGDDDGGEDDAEDDRASQKAAKDKAARAKDKAAKDKAAKDKAARAKDKAAKDKVARAKAAKAAKDKAAREGDDDGGDEGDGDEDDDGGERVADGGDDGDSDDGDDGELDGDLDDDLGDDDGARDPRTRPVDIAAGLSLTARRLSFTTNLTSNKPLGYKSNPVAGVFIAADVFPLAFNRNNRSITRNLGLTLVVDRVIKIDSRIKQGDTTYPLPTTEQHLGFGLIYRHLIGDKLTVNVSLRYNKRKFVIDRSSAAMPDDVDIPNVDYTYVDPGLGVRYLLGAKMALGADARFMLITDTGAMQKADQYGGATVTGIDLEGRFDYQVGHKLLIRAALGLDRIKFSFKGTGLLSNNRDGDEMTKDVSAASDLYFGGALTGVYLF